MSDLCHGRPMLDRFFRHAELMDRMMERVGIDASGEPPEFCSDAEFFRRLRPKVP